VDGRKGARRAARENALQVLFWLDGTDLDVDASLRTFHRHFEFEADAQQHTEALVRGVAERISTLDSLLVEASRNWRIERMSRLDRNLLRLAAWELRERHDIPRSVILDEAVEIAKSFGSEDSSAFVNGVLNRVADILGRKDTDV
jgi:transcription antitermination protein NusB